MMMRKVSTIAVLAALLIITPVLALAQEWRQSSADGVQIAQISAQGMTPSGATETKLILKCRAGKDGAISLVYRINGVDKIKGFNFDDFEGPDAVAANRKLTTFTVQSAEGNLAINTALGAYYSGEEKDSFDFEFSALNNSHGDLRRLINALMKGATKIVVKVQDSKDKSKFLQTEFPTAGSAAAISAAMKGIN
jgi:hypothetical protein